MNSENHTKEKEAISELVEKYKEVVKNKTDKSYKEEEVKKDFILPLFNILGWKTNDKKEVSAEDHIKNTGRPDYNFKINEITQFYLETKSFNVGLEDEKSAFQAINYSWNKGVTYAILTDFESIKVFNAQRIDKTDLMDRMVFKISCDNYIEDFETLWHLSKHGFQEKTLNAYAEKHGKKEESVSVSTVIKKLNADIQWCRERLTESFEASNENKNIPKDMLDEGVQKLLDRLIFLRVAEDRDVEPNILRNLLREVETSSKGHDPFGVLVSKFREMDKIYDSNLFSEHPFEKWEEYGGALKEVIEKLYGKKGQYEYNFKEMPADILGSVYESYLSYKLTATKQDKSLFSENREKVLVHKDAKKRKEQGIFYTPPFVVDYIVRNALKPVLDKCKSISDLKKIKVLDPSCGSGSFLIKALEAIAEKYDEFGSDNPFIKRTILLENIFGVDLDAQAVEIARLNLLINSLDERGALPLLAGNIKNGNSLISGTDEEMKKQFGKDWKDKRPFNWQEEFPEVFKQGGFDVIIGNPPYLKELDNKEVFQEIKKSNFGKYYQGKMDFWYFFLHKSIEILKDGGVMAFITNSYFLKRAGATKLINHLQNEMVLIKAVDFQDIKVFEDVSGRHLIHIWQKVRNRSNTITKYLKLNKNSFDGIIDDSKYIELSYTEVIKNSSISFETNIQTNSKHTILLGSLYDVSQGVVEATGKISKKLLENTKNKECESGDGVFVLSETELQGLNLDQKEKLIIKKYLDTKDIQKYYINFNNEYLIYSDKKEKNKIADGEYTHVKSHLDKMKQFITSSNAPYGLHRPRENKYFENQKLICKGMFLSPEFCFDDEKYYVGFSFSVIIQKDKNYDLKYLLGLLNSKFGENWFNSNGKKRGVGVDIGVAVFRNFPVYKANKEQQKEIVVLVDKMIFFNKELHETPENSDKWDSLKSEIEKTDKKIDQEVYKLYDLTADEIKIIEDKIS